MVSAFLAMAFLITPFGCLMLSILIYWKPEQNRRYVFFIGLSFGLIGYCMEPVREIDISRYFMQLDSIRYLPFSEALNWNNDGLVIKNLAFWSIAKLNNNHVLPFVSMFIVYFCVALLVSKGTKEDARLFGVLLLLEFMILPLFNIFSNVRNVMAFALASVAVYRDLYERKRNIVTALLYFIPCFIHMTGIAVLFIRLSVLLTRRLSHVGSWLILGIPTLIVSLYPFMRGIHLPGSVGLIVQRLIWKSYSSVVRTSEYAQAMQESGSFMARRLLTVFFAIALYVILLQYHKDMGLKNSQDYAFYVEILLIFTVILSVLGVVKYWVFAFLLFLSATPIYAYGINKAKQHNHVSLLCNVAMFTVAGMSFILQLRSIHLNVLLSDLISRFILTDYLVILFQILRGFLTI